MKTTIWDGALLVGFVLALSVLYSPNGMAQDFQPEFAFSADPVALEGALEDVRGKGNEDLTMDKLLSATLANNISINNGSITASNSILDNSFANSSGFLTVIQNAADNVVIQAATSLNVYFNP